MFILWIGVLGVTNVSYLDERVLLAYSLLLFAFETKDNDAP